MTLAFPRRARVLAVLLVLQLAAAGVVVTTRSGEASAPRSPSARGGPPVASAPARTRAVRALLDGRARALLARDRAAFLAGVDPAAGPFVARQAALFDALAGVPLSTWAYTLDPGRSQPADPALARRYGTWWAPRVVLGVGLAGVDTDPAESDQVLTFVQRDGRWLVAADDDFAARGAATARQLWDGGPVLAVRGEHSLVLGHPGAAQELARLARDVDAAVPRATAVWGDGWSQRVVVVVPADQAELARMVQARGSLAPIAALAVAGPVRGGTARGGDRVFVNPPNLAVLGEVGRRVVLTHEITHVAARAATGDATPAWLSEGLADHVGFLGTGAPVRVAAGDVRDDLRAGRLPAALPADADFDGGNPRLSSAYEQAWLAVELLVATYGQDRVLATYREVGAAPGPAAAAVEQALERLGTTTAAFTAAWQGSLRRQLA